MDQRPHVVIIGGGFGGLRAAQELRRAPVQVTLLDRRNYHLFQPLLYQVAAGGLSPANIASPLRSILKRQRNTRVLLAEVTDIDVGQKRVILRDGQLAYDTLIVATGSGHHYFGHPEWEPYAPSLKNIEDATAIRRRILLAFETAERESDPQRLHGWLTFIIVGAGPTGVELAGAVAELARHTLRHEYRAIDPARARIILVEGQDRVLPTYPPSLSARALTALGRLGVMVRTKTFVTELGPEAVCVRSGPGAPGVSERIPANTTLWAAGVEASPLARALARASGTTPDRAGRVVVQPDCTLPGHPEIFVIGDMANFSHQGPGAPGLPGVAPVAIQQGRYVARLIDARLRGQTLPPFRYHDRGTVATIGRGAAVADLGGLRLSGYVAWLAWLFIHLLYLVGFQNRLLVLVQWAWSYVTRNRSARLITGVRAPPLVADPPASSG
jgi:NADH dehydrogenase